MNYTSIQIEGEHGGPILVDVPNADVPKWLGGQLIDGQPNYIVTILPYSEIHKSYTPISPEITDIPSTVDRELVHLLVDIADKQETLHKDLLVKGRQYRQSYVAYNEYLRAVLKPSDTITNIDTAFTVEELKDLGIASEITRIYLAEGKDHLAMFVGFGKLDDEFCRLAGLSADCRVAVDGYLTGKSHLEASLSESIATMKDGTTDSSFDAHVFRSHGYCGTPRDFKRTANCRCACQRRGNSD